MNWPVFDHVVTDYSRENLYAISRSWNNMNLIDYINLIYDVIHGKSNDILNKISQMHLCYAHLITNFQRIIEKRFKILSTTETDQLLILRLLNYFANMEVRYDSVKNV